MKAMHLSLLRCPYCETPFRSETTGPTTNQGLMHFGVISCSCDEFPIVDGIIFLKKDKGQLLNKQAVQLIRAKNFVAARLILIEERKKVRWVFQWWSRFLPPHRRASWLTLSRLLWLLKIVNPGSTDWYRYLLSRHRRATFILSLMTLSFTRPSQVVVDIGCGAGHWLKHAAKINPTQRLIGIDYSFSLLLLARHFLVNDRTMLICADIEYGLPLKPKSLDFIAVNDAFMYLHKKIAFIREALTLLKKSGWLSLLHVHAKGGHNLGQGYGVQLNEMKKYAVGVTLFANTDQALFKGAMVDQQLSYLPFRQMSGHRLATSYSFLMTRRLQPAIKKIPESLVSLMKKTDIDFTEDENLRVTKI